MVNLIKSLETDIPAFIDMEKFEGTAQYIIAYSEQKHQREMRKSDLIYLSIVVEEKLSGFIILATQIDSSSVEFRRIVVSPTGNGIGQLAIQAMEAYCSNILHASRIWLDVFESNQRGQHIYIKLGYRQFKAEQYDDNILLYMEKQL